MIAVYIVREDGLLTVPFTSVADQTLNLLLKRFANKPSDIQLLLVIDTFINCLIQVFIVIVLCEINSQYLFSFHSPTLYIGQHRHGLYALPSLVDSTTATISSNIGQLLLEGPLSVPQLAKNDNGNVSLSNSYFDNTDFIAQTGYQAVITLGNGND